MLVLHYEMLTGISIVSIEDQSRYCNEEIELQNYKSEFTRLKHLFSTWLWKTKDCVYLLAQVYTLHFLKNKTGRYLMILLVGQKFPFDERIMMDIKNHLFNIFICQFTCRMSLRRWLIWNLSEAFSLYSYILIDHIAS